MGSNVFPRLQRKTSHMVLLSMYCACDYSQADVSSGVSRREAVSYHREMLPGVHYKLASHILTIFRISRIMDCWILIYSDYHLF